MPPSDIPPNTTTDDKNVLDLIVAFFDDLFSSVFKKESGDSKESTKKNAELAKKVDDAPISNFHTPAIESPKEYKECSAKPSKSTSSSKKKDASTSAQRMEGPSPAMIVLLALPWIAVGGAAVGAMTKGVFCLFKKKDDDSKSSSGAGGGDDKTSTIAST